MKNKISSLIGIPLVLISTNTYSQTLLTINAEVVNSKKMFSPIPVLFPVEQQEVEINGQKRQAYILQRGKTISIDSEEAFATYKEISSDVGYNDKAIPNISVAKVAFVVLSGAVILLIICSADISPITKRYQDK